MWFIFQFLMRPIFSVCLRLRIRGAEKLPDSGGVLLLINHQSFLDPFLVGLPLSRPVSYIARDTLFLIPLVGWLLKRNYAIPINRESAGTAILKDAVRRIRHGFVVGIFPEGTRSPDGSVGALKPGFVAIVRRSGAPIFPVGIAGAREALPRNAWFLRPRRVCIVFGDPLNAEEIQRYTKRGQEQKLVALVRERIIACQQQADRWRSRSSLFNENL